MIDYLYYYCGIFDRKMSIFQKYKCGQVNNFFGFYSDGEDDAFDEGRLFYKRKQGKNHPVGKGPGRVLWKGGGSVEEGPSRLRVVEPGVERPGAEEPGVVGPEVEKPGVVGPEVVGPGAEMVRKETVRVVPLVVKLKVGSSLRRLLILVLTLQMKSILSLPLPHGINLGFTWKPLSCMVQ